MIVCSEVMSKICLTLTKKGSINFLLFLLLKNKTEVIISGLKEDSSSQHSASLDVFLLTV